MAEETHHAHENRSDKVLSGIADLSVVFGGAAFAGAIGAAIGGPIITGGAALFGAAIGAGLDVWARIQKRRRERRYRRFEDDPRTRL
jgi:hypothetical protein